ncbi:MAG: tRNA (N6-isopentenyl adenosine(37)-C2)-methylthiotransferase MiaB [Chloroflexi bacterium]|nr:tRNA (N6-isopentenyl adenosine(37)-C2)-methylthiotransferase MiaB [Chloroflexota bacterium]
MRYHIWTVGCQMNVADSQKLASGLDKLGWSEVAEPANANLVVLNTCAIRDHAEHRAVSKLGTLKKLRGNGSDFKIAVMGCMVGPKTDELKKRFPYVDVFAQPQNFEPIMEAIGYEDTGGEFWPSTFVRPESPTAYVPIVHGCDKFCTFCIVPYRRGRERSRTIEDIHEEVAHLAAGGVREVTVLGQTVEAYGHDLDDTPDLGDLLRALHDIDGIVRLRFLTSYPKDMTERIIDAVAELPKVCEYFNIPVQSGDNDVLDRMQRGYSIELYREKVELIRRKVPDVAITTDLIVGFCGETDEEFQSSYDLLEELQFDKVHAAAYSDRPGTIAHRKLEDDVPQEVKMARFHKIEQLEAGISSRINSRYLGQEVEVLVEGKKPRPEPAISPGGDSLSHPERVGSHPEPVEGRRPRVDMWYGRNRQNKLVHFTGDAIPGDLVTVRIEHASPWSLVGEAVENRVPA